MYAIADLSHQRKIPERNSVGCLLCAYSSEEPQNCATSTNGPYLLQKLVNRLGYAHNLLQENGSPAILNVLIAWSTEWASQRCIIRQFVLIFFTEINFFFNITENTCILSISCIHSENIIKCIPLESL